MMNPLRILLPKDIKHALELLADSDNTTRIIAGGTDVITGLNQGSKRFSNISALVDINGIKELKIIKNENGIISIGAGATFSEITGSKIVNGFLPILSKAAKTIGSVQIRNRATIAGNFVNNAPCADTVPALLIYDATVVIESLNSSKEIPLSSFLKGPYKTGLKNDEIVTKINIPIPPAEFKGDFYKLGRRRAVAISRITLAVLAGITNGKIDEIRIASGAVTPTGTRFYDLEKSLAGKTINNDLLTETSTKLGNEILNITGLRWSSEYKLPVVQQVFYQMLCNITNGNF